MRIDAELLNWNRQPAAALDTLDSLRDAPSRLLHTLRAEILEALNRPEDAAAERRRAAEFPPDRQADQFRAASNHLRKREFEPALTELDELLRAEPEHSTARLFQGLCLLHLNRPAEARIAVTACIAQRPRCVWSYFLRSIVEAELGFQNRALEDNQAALDCRPSETARFAVEHRRMQ